MEKGDENHYRTLRFLGEKKIGKEGLYIILLDMSALWIPLAYGEYIREVSDESERLGGLHRRR